MFSCEEPSLLLVQLLEGGAVKSFAETLSMQRDGRGGGGYGRGVMGATAPKRQPAREIVFLFFFFVDHTWRPVGR